MGESITNPNKMKIRKYIVVERNEFGSEVICGYGCKSTLFETKDSAKSLYEIV